MRILVIALGGTMLVLATSCGPSDATPPAPLAPDPPAAVNSAAPAPAPPPPGAAAGPFDARLLEVAREYGRWPKITSSLGWAATDCAAPEDHPLHAGASDDAATHGQKLYYLFARERGAYLPRRGEPAPVGQVIVKESWTPILVPPGEPVKGDIAVRGGQRYRAGEGAGLFLMMKLDPATAGTDQGWVYGVVSADGARVTAAGRLDACAGCHVGAPFDRLFGPPS